MGLGGLEPPTSSLSGKRSNRLSYRPSNTDHGADSEKNCVFSDGAATTETTVTAGAPPNPTSGRQSAQLRHPQSTAVQPKSVAQWVTVIGQARWEAGSIPMPTMPATRCRLMS